MAQACGNGMRCVVQALAAETGQKALHLRDGGRHPQRRGARGRLDLRRHGHARASAGRRFRWPRNSATPARIELQIGPIDAPVLHSPSVASMGNPHAIFWVDRRRLVLRSRPLRAAAREPSDLPRARQHLDRPGDLAATRSILRTWERGAGLTSACGSAACAAAVAAARTGRTGRKRHGHRAGRRRCTIDWRDDDHVVMTGPAEWEFSGTFDPATGAWARDQQDVA